MAEAPKRKKKFIKAAIKHPGALHRELGVPEGKKIPEAALEKAAHSDDSTLRHRAQFAEELKGFHHHASKAAKLYRGKTVRRG